ncbi:MAG: M6 family metalloprotease domain-containing protein [Candidatus Krumholzibacteriales bacterium]
MYRRPILFLAAFMIIIFSIQLSAQVYPPREEVEYPRGYLERIKKDKTAFRFQKAWIQKAELARENRKRILREFSYLENSESVLRSSLAETAVSGTAGVPVFMVKFQNTGSNPYPSSDLQQELFDGPWATGTMTGFYDEISYGNLNLTGTVSDWFLLSENDTYYEGSENGLGSDSKVGQLILETLNNWDSSIDFGQYDNDGPDGVPNSGDDDGYVDFVSFVHAEAGGECGNTNIWSHRWVVTGWPEFSYPYQTNDPRSGGGYIKVYDYTIQPALSCSSSMIEIGVFCHEFGHAFGLPDLYDTNGGGGSGIGHWGLMGSGSWNQPESPAHMCAWSKMQLGWIIPAVVGPDPASYSINNVEFNSEAYRLNVMEERWRRLTQCAITGSYSMHCGLTAAEATIRNWPGGAGYGNGWNETVSRTFSYDGTDPVNLAFDYSQYSEQDFDFTYLTITVNGTETVVETYHGISSGAEFFDLSSYLSGSGASEYQISFRFESDYAYSDADENFNSSCGGAFTFDNVSVTGGGENYSTGFESYEDGWYVDMSDPAEFFLVENRQALGFDQYVHGDGGLNIWHVSQDIATTGNGNTGGAGDNQPRGVVMEEADGLNDLLLGNNRGDGGDPFPGTSSNTLFDNGSAPNSLSNNQLATNVAVSSISASGDPMTATMRGGWLAPSLVSVTPDTADVSEADTVDIAAILGTRLNYGATFYLTNGTDPDIPALGAEWVGHEKMTGTIDISGANPGLYDVVVENPDGQTAVLPDGFEITGSITDAGDPGLPERFALGQNYPNPFNPSTIIPFEISERQPVTLRVYDVNGKLIRTLVDNVLSPDAYRVQWNGKNDRGMDVISGVYFYRVQAGKNFSAVRKLILLR